MSELKLRPSKEAEEKARRSEKGSGTMVAMKYLLMILGTVVLGSAAGLVAYDIFISTQLRRLLRRGVA
ncbi:MAG TPA: hypothetical protein VOA78_07655 [Candidatus Dormibacteraeota bacterium]|nr:hypothetical protein [Candidatus Dormibacteraeota bacterium]